MSAVEILAGRFRSAASYYLSGRPAYAEALIERVAELVGLERRHCVLDVGTGPGQLAIAFARHAGEVVAIDPEPEMLERARANARAAQAPVVFHQASSNDLGPKFGLFRLTTIGRAFHWTNRPDTLRRLDEITEPDGAVVLFSDAHPRAPDNRWTEAYDEALKPYREGDKAIDRGPSWIPHEAILLDSPFSRLERVGVIERRRTPIPRFSDRALSLGAVWQRLDPLQGNLEQAVSAALAPYANDDGTVTEVVESVALIARRT